MDSMFDESVATSESTAEAASSSFISDGMGVTSVSLVMSRRRSISKEGLSSSSFILPLEEAPSPLGAGVEDAIKDENKKPLGKVASAWKRKINNSAGNVNLFIIEWVEWLS